MSYQLPEARRLRMLALVAISSLMAAACTATTQSVGDLDDTNRSDDVPSSVTLQGATVEALASPATTTPATTAPTTTTSTTSSTTTSTTTSSTTTTTTEPPLDVFAPECVVRAAADTSLEAVARANDVADVVALWFENDRPDIIAAGTLVDLCVGNAVNDIDGQARPPIDAPTLESAVVANIERQQAKLNELFADAATTELAVDGVSGPRTGQRLCAARLALGLTPTTADMAPGSAEQAALFAAASLPTPTSTATESERWVLIDRTCQIMFVGAREQTVFVFPTSTGSEGYETRDQDRAEAFRFNPALDNGGWHDSSEYPVGVDNPLNGNLYKPLYFDLGQAIHGANNVPPTPASKGCARLSVADQDALVAWLGLDTATGETWRKSEINVTVNVQGAFVDR